MLTYICCKTLPNSGERPCIVNGLISLDEMRAFALLMHSQPLVWCSGWFLQLDLLGKFAFLLCLFKLNSAAHVSLFIAFDTSPATAIPILQSVLTNLRKYILEGGFIVIFYASYF